MKKKKANIFGIIHVGSTYMTLQIVSYTDIDTITIIENASRQVTFGEEVFQTHRLSFASIDEICETLKGFCRLLKEYDVQDYHVYATTAIREAENRENIIDQVQLRTGMNLDVIDLPKEIYYKYFALYRQMMKNQITFDDEAILFMDITAGGVGVTIWKSGELLFQQNVHIGALRIWESFDRNQRDEEEFPVAIREYIHGVLHPLWRMVQTFKVRYFVLSGMEARRMGDIMNCREHAAATWIEPKYFQEFLGTLSATRLMHRYGLSESDANLLIPSMLLYYEVLQMVDVEKIIIMNTSFIEGVVMYHGAEAEKNPYLAMQREENLNLARNIGKKYLYNEEHAKNMERFAQIFYAALQPAHGLPERAGYLLRMAAILHEIGKFVNLRSHSQYSYELIMGTDIFGLTEGEKAVVATLAYFHYKGVPTEDNEKMKLLVPRQRRLVRKLVPIFRLCRALNQGHDGKIKEISAALKKNRLEVRYTADMDISLERWTFQKESEYFQEVYGVLPVLVKG